MKKRKDILLAVIGIALVGLGMYLVKAIPDPQHMMKTLPYLCIGLGCGTFGHGLGSLFNRKAAQKDPVLARQIEIDTQDERNVMIGNMAKAKGFDMSTYVYAALLLAFALMGLSFSVVIPFVASYLFVQGYAVYYRFKIEKEQ